MRFQVKIVNQLSPEVGTMEVSLSALKQVIRAKRTAGYKTNPKRFSQWVLDTRTKGGLPLVLNTARNFDAFALYIKMI